MPPTIALFLTTAFVAFLVWRDLRERAQVTAALWIPVIWMLLTASRPLSFWLGFGGAIYDTPADLVEGSPLDRIVFIVLELAAFVVLFRRGISWSTVLSRNLWLTVFLAYCGVSIMWSDFPFAAFKRWIKVLGLPMMVLILATEPNPREAIVRLMKRSAYVLVPFSILLIKYYPHLGRAFDPWSGAASNTGVTSNKNELGYVCMLLGFFFFWHLLTILRREKTPERRNELWLIVAFFYMIGWLLFMSSSATSVVSLVLGMSIVLSFSVRSVDVRQIVAYWAGGLLIFSCAELFFGVSDVLASALGRDPTLSGRRELWAQVLTSNTNPIVGAGFESFWLGGQAVWLWSEYWWRPNQAHNGYLETFLNLGWIGVILLVGSILSAFWKAYVDLFSEFDFGRFRLGIVAITIVYNCTEAAFKGVHPVWFLFFIAAIDCPYSPPIPREVRSSLSRFPASARRRHLKPSR